MASPSNYQRGLELAQGGQFEQALAAMQEHLRLLPCDAQALNDTGAILYSLGRLAEAADHLQRALKAQPLDPQSLGNLVEVHLAGGNPAAAMAFLDDLAGAGALEAETVHRIALAFMERHDHANAIEAMIRVRSLSPDEPGLADVLRRVRALRPRIALVLAQEPSPGLDDIIAFLDARFEVRMIRGLEERQGDAFAEAVNWSQIAWFEGCTQALAAATQASGSALLVCRLAAADLWNPWFDQVRWARLAAVMAPSPGLVEQLLRRCETLAGKTRLVPRGLAAEAIAFSPRQGGRLLAHAGPLNHAANLPLLLQCLAALRRSGDYRLFLAGVFDDDALEQYVLHMIGRLGLAGAVTFDGWQGDLPAYLADKHFLVSAALCESQAPAILTAMAAGLKPVVHEYSGADELLPRPMLFATIDEFCQRVAEPYDAAAGRRFVLERYPLAPMLSAANEVLLDLERQIAPPGPHAHAAGAQPGRART